TSLRASLKKRFGAPRMKQSIRLLGANVLGIPVSVASSVLTTSLLGPARFGDLRFIQTLLNLSALLVTVGYFQSANRALVISKEQRVTREIYGASLAIFVVISLVLASGLVAFALLDNNVQEKELSGYLISIAPFAWVVLCLRF